jgi:ClpP class serine protease
MWLIFDRENVVHRIESIESNAPIQTNLLDCISGESTTPVVKDGTAIIPVKGVLMKNRSAVLDRYGIQHTAYTDVEKSITKALAKGSKKIVLETESPGGRTEGLLDLMDFVGGLRNFNIRTETRIGDLCASAAFMLASQTDKIIAQHDLSLVGSVGVASAVAIPDGYRDITNSDSRNKRPDVSTKQGIAVVERELDDVYGVLAERIADGRRTSLDTVKRRYGQGSVMTARTALSRGMIDEIEHSKAASTAITSNAMAKAEFEANHPGWVFEEYGGSDMGYESFQPSDHAFHDEDAEIKRQFESSHPGWVVE